MNRFKADGWPGVPQLSLELIKNGMHIIIQAIVKTTDETQQTELLRNCVKHAYARNADLSYPPISVAAIDPAQ